jgi:hypothetical protein
MAEIGDIYPGTNEHIVAKIPAPGGGFWLQGEQGGVFAEGGAPFLGSYFSPEMAVNRNDPNRRFTGIEATAGGGYRSLTATPGEAGYEFFPTTPTTTTTTQTPTAAEIRATSPAGASAKATIAATLQQFGLDPSLAQTLWTDWYVNEGRPIEQISLDIQQTPQFKARFPGFDTLAQKGLAWSPAQYIQYEQSVTQAMQAAGLPAGFYDSHDDFGDFIKNGWSPNEIVDAVEAAGTAAQTAPPETLATLKRWGITDGDMTAFWLNPDKAMPFIERKFLYGTAQLAGAGERGGFGAAFGGELTQAEAAAALQGGATAETLGNVTRLAPLFSETAEESSDLGRATALGAAAGQAGAEEALAKRRAARQARFSGGGGAAGIGGQQSGLGSAT